MTALPIISIVCSIAYIFFILCKYGVPVSISETYYLLPNKWDWLFAAWSILTSVPLGIYWWTSSPDNLKWIPVTVMIALLLVGAACCYKSGPKEKDNYNPLVAKGEYARDISSLYKEKKSWWQQLIDYLKTSFNPKNFFKYGPARLIHYLNSIIAITLSTTYLCLVYGRQAIANTIISYAVWIIIGAKTDGVYNPDYSLDVNNKAWIFFMEIICLTNLFIFIL